MIRAGLFVAVVLASCARHSPPTTLGSSGGGSGGNSSGTSSGAGGAGTTSGMSSGASSGSSSGSAPLSVGGETIPDGVSMTTVQVTDSVQTADVAPFAVNISVGDNLKNLLTNPGFEPAIYNTVFIADGGSSSGHFESSWTGASAQTTGFWNGATYEILTGPGQGRTGTVSSFTANGSVFTFALSDATVPAALAGNTMVVHLANLPGLGGNAGQTDTTNPHSGLQSLVLAKNANLLERQDTTWQEIDPSAGKLILVSGHWHVEFWARGQNGGETVRVVFQRGVGSALPVSGNIIFIDHSFTLTTAWAKYSADVTVAAGVDEETAVIDPPQSTWQSRGELSFGVTNTSSASANIWIDDADWHNADDATNPTAFTDAFVNALAELHPGALRYFEDQGETLANLLATDNLRKSSGYQTQTNTAGVWSFSLHEFLQLCAQLRVDPWFVVPATFSAADATGLIDYLAAASGGSNAYANTRAALGQSAPWTTVFEKIHLQLGEDAWGSGTNGDPFAGADFGNATEYGRVADLRFSAMQANPSFAAARFELIVGGETFYADAQSQIESTSTHHDALALPFYLGALTDTSSEQNVFGALFASAAQLLSSDGILTLDLARAQKNGVPDRLVVDEANMNELPGVDAATANPFLAGLGAGLGVPFTLLAMQQGAHISEADIFNATGQGYALTYNIFYQNQVDDLWGLLRDVRGPHPRRPLFHTLRAINQVMSGDLVSVALSGDTSGWTQAAVNGITAPIAMTDVNVFAYKDATRYGLVLFNLSTSKDHGVIVSLPPASVGSATLYEVDSDTLSDTNEASDTVMLTTTSVTDFGSGYTLLLPAHSLRTVSWPIP